MYTIVLAWIPTAIASYTYRSSCLSRWECGVGALVLHADRITLSGSVLMKSTVYGLWPPVDFLDTKLSFVSAYKSIHDVIRYLRHSIPLGAKEIACVCSLELATAEVSNNKNSDWALSGTCMVINFRSETKKIFFNNMRLMMMILTTTMMFFYNETRRYGVPAMHFSKL